MLACFAGPFMNEITIRPEMTFHEYYAGQNALMYGRHVRVITWAVVAVGAALLASSAALTWGTPASVLAGMALAAFAFSISLTGQITTARRQQAYKRYRDDNTSYTFTTEKILATSRYAHSSFAWAAVDRVIEKNALYLLSVGNTYICIPKRDIPPQSVGDFTQLLTKNCLVRRP